MKTKAQLINRFHEHHINKSVGIEENVLITDEIDLPPASDLEVKKSKKYYSYYRQAVSLSGKQFIEVPRNNPMERLAKYGIFPRSKYTMEVYLQIAYMAAEKRSLDYIVEHMRKDFPALDDAHLSRKFVERVLLLTSAVVTPYLPELTKLNRPWNLIIDGTVRTSGNSTLIIVLAHFPDDDSIFPLLSCFLPSENKQDLNKILFELKGKLSTLPQAVVSDFSMGFQASLPEVFCESVMLGCHFHAIELIARNLIYPSIKILNKKIRLFINKLKSIIRQILHRNKRNKTLRLFAQTLRQIISRHQGDFGRKLIIMIEKLKVVQDCLYENRKFCGNQYKQLKSLFSRQKWEDIENASEQLATVLEQFDLLRDCLRPDNLFTSEAVAKKSLRKIITNWKKNKSIPELEKAAETLNLHFDYLIPAMYNPNFPRTTSILEGLNNQVKRAMRHWCGTQQLPLSFEWVGELLSVIIGIGDVTQWSDILTQIPLKNWIMELEKLRVLEKERKSEIKFARRLASLEPSGLRRQLELMFKVGLAKEVVN